MRYGYIGNQCYYEVKAIRGSTIGIVHDSYVKWLTNPCHPSETSLVSFAASKPGAPTKPVLPLDNGARPPPSASVKNGVASKTRVSASRAGSGGSPTPMNQPNFGAPAATTDKAGFLLCAHGVRTRICLLCQGKTQNPKPGATGAAAGVQTPTLDITTATSPAFATGPGPSFSPASETAGDLTSGPFGPASRTRANSSSGKDPKPVANGAATSPAFATGPGPSLSPASETAGDLTSGPFGPASRTRANSPSGKDPKPVATGAAGGVQPAISKKRVSPRIKHSPPQKSCSKSSNNAANRTRNTLLNPPQVSSAARPAPSRAVVPQIAKKSAKPARAGAKKNTELKTTRANKKKVCQRNSVNRARKCKHDRRATRCPDCVRSSGDGFRSLCPHLKQKGWCTQCKMENSETVYYGEARR